MHLFFLLSIFLFTSVSQASASRSISITSLRTDLLPEQEYQITASVSGFTENETIHIKGAFYKEGTDGYFGFTKDGNNWIKNSQTTTTQRQVNITSWDKLLISKLDFSDSDFQGGGPYKFKIGFYYPTSSGLSSVQWSENSLDINLTAPTPTATPGPTSTPTPTNTPTPVPATSTPLPTITPRPTSTPKPSSTPFPQPRTPSSPDVQTIQNTNFVNPTSEADRFFSGEEEFIPTPVVLGESVSRDSDPSSSFRFSQLITPVLILSGAGALGVGFFLLLRRPA